MLETNSRTKSKTKAKSKKGDKTMTERMLTPMQAIRAKCLDCSAGSSNEVKLCEILDCALHYYRFGKNPNRKGHEAWPSLNDNYSITSCRKLVKFLALFSLKI